MALRNCSMCREDKDDSLFNKMKNGYLGLQRYCRACQAIHHKSYREKNREKLVAAQSNRYHRNKETIAEVRKSAYWLDPIYKQKVKDRASAWNAKNREKISARMKDYIKENSAKISASKKDYRKKNAKSIAAYEIEYRKSNRSKIAGMHARRRAAKSGATVAWACKERINSFYLEAQRLTRETGIKHHVDHIVPLQSKLVCGLHCEANLQVITAFENISKLNRYWPDMPEE